DIEHYKIKDVEIDDVSNSDPKTHIDAFSYYVPIKIDSTQYAQ
ncbi:MDR efflux pump AcrAB transcriptional activator RobA, partial [Bacillus subtilis]